MIRLLALVMASLLVLPATLAHADSSSNFVISIDGQDVPIDVGQKVKVQDKAGHDIEVGLKQSEISTWKGDFVTFQHANDVNVTSTELDAGLKQHMMATNNGTLVIVQEYASIDPRSLADLMLTQIAKADASSAKLDKKSGTRKLTSGKTLEGLTATAPLKRGSASRMVRYEVMTAGTEDHGIVAVTRIDDDLGTKDQAMIDRFWATLALAF